MNSCSFFPQQSIYRLSDKICLALQRQKAPNSRYRIDSDVHCRPSVSFALVAINIAPRKQLFLSKPFGNLFNLLTWCCLENVKIMVMLLGKYYNSGNAVFKCHNRGNVVWKMIQRNMQQNNWLLLAYCLDCNSVLMGTPSSVIQPVQKVQNTAARVIHKAPRHKKAHLSYSNSIGSQFLNE